MPKGKVSKCFDCKNAYAHKCKWVRGFKPIEGWKAEKREYYDTSGTGFTYVVISCPNFKHDLEQQRQLKVIDDNIIHLAQNTDLSVREIAKIYNCSGFYVSKVIKDVKRTKRCIECGKRFIVKRNFRKCESCRADSGAGRTKNR